MKTTLTCFLAVLSLCATLALADDSNLPTIDGNMSILPSAEETQKALTSAAMADPALQQHLLAGAQGELDASKPRRETHREGLDFRVSVPEGVGVAFSYSPAAPITTAISVNTLAGATVSVSAEATFNTMWWYSPMWKHGFTPTITVKFSHIRFTGAIVDDIVNKQLEQ
ncbi:MAG: hypothetical protein HY075_05045, partial [Deltaproteobacteria bacterium]|nr:hypothetical protein [Deltaproteobacteria bacterium]